MAFARLPLARVDLAGGDDAHNVLSVLDAEHSCGAGLFQYFDMRDARELRLICREFKVAVAAFPWDNTPSTLLVGYCEWSAIKSTRIKSRIISSSLATVLVGRQTGGDLPSILEQSASTLREMARLEGVVRTKTAEGKMQATVLAVIPFVLLFALHQVDNNWLRPLFQTTIGYVVLMAATILWASAILVARRILTVDI